jgi:hypothetical protein
MFRKIRVFWLAVIAALMASVLVQASPALASGSKIAFLGTAYGTEVSVSGIVKSGRSALSQIGCTDVAGVTHTNSVATVTAPGLSTGTVTTSAASETTSTGVASTSSSTTQGASLLGGLVSATTIQSVSTTSRDNTSGTFSTSAAGTQFVGLSVLGIPISGTPAPNTTIPLPGVGSVILNQQTNHGSGTKANLTVIGIHVMVTLSTPLAPIGTQIIVSFAHSGLGGPFAGLLSGLAYAAQAKVLGGALILGEEFPQPLGCFGTGGVVKTNGGALINGLGLVLSGTAVDTAEGVNNHKKSQAETTSTIQNLNLMNGLVTATAIKADVTANGNPPTLGDNSTFLDLSVNGNPVSDTPPPNTKISLAGIGTLWLHRVFMTSNSIRVVMIQLVVTVPGAPLPVGTTVNIANAQVGIK